MSIPCGKQCAQKGKYVVGYQECSLAICVCLTYPQSVLFFFSEAFVRWWIGSGLNSLKYSVKVTMSKEGDWYEGSGIRSLAVALVPSFPF